ncbi:hypothetical protein ACXN5S_12425 [Pseudoroseicyclus sp. H15]
MSAALQKAREAWGAELPDWVVSLAEACAASSQNKVAARVGYSGAVISGVLSRRYRGDMSAVEERVRGALMRAVVDCPALGELPTNECADWRKKARQFSGHNSQRVRMYRACHGCPRFKREPEA